MTRAQSAAGDSADRIITELVLPPAEPLPDLSYAEQLAMYGTWVRRDTRQRPVNRRHGCIRTLTAWLFPRAIVGALAVVSVAGVFSLAEFVAHRWNPFA